MSKLNQLTIRQALTGLENKDFSRVELVQACLDQIHKYDKDLNAFLFVREEEALAQAKAMDDKPLGLPLEGIPIALKDLYVTKGVRTTAGSKVLETYIPQYDGTVVKKLKDAGAIIIGKLNEDAWGHGASGENSDFGPTKNPWDLTRVPGGSSSGSGASVAADMCFGATGTDTGSSVRSPAAFCSQVGIKPTYGRVSRSGVIAFASSLDTIGNITKIVWDNAYLLSITAGRDPLDATTIESPVPHYHKNLDSFLFKEKQIKIGVPKEYFAKGTDPEVKESVLQAINKYEELGAKIETVSLPYTEYGVAAYYIIAPCETSSNLSRYDGIRFGNDRSSFGSEAKRRIMIGTYALSAGYADQYYKKALKVRTLIKQDFDKVFSKVDILIAPVVPTPPFVIGEKAQDPLQMYLADTYCIPVNMAGIPALALPCGFTKSGLPIGMQIMGPHFSEELLFQVGHAYEQATEWHTMKPKMQGLGDRG